MREDQIQRYGRQILLREVGGKGQRRLLERPVRVLAPGPAIAEAVTYLAAGGTPVELPPGLALDGFLAGASLGGLSPDAVAAAPAWAELLPVGATSTAPVQVVVGQGVAFRDERACAACFALARAALPEGGEAPVVVGSLAALALQRLALGWSEPLGLVRWRDGRLEHLTPPLCPDHAG